MGESKEDIKRKFADLQTKISKEDNGEITLDLTEAKHGSAVAKALDVVERASWRSPDADEIEALIMQANAEIKTYADEANKNKSTVESAVKLRSNVKKTLENITFHYKELNNIIKGNLDLEGNPEVQTALRLSGSAISYITARVNTKLTSAWISNYEIESEQAAVEEVRGYVDDLDALVQKETDDLDKVSRDRKIAQSTLDLALSKLEGLARTVSDTGTNKEIQVQKAIEDSEAFYLQAKRRFGYEDNLDASVTEELMKKISEAETIAKKVSMEHQEKTKAKDTMELRVRKLSMKLETIMGMVDACGTLVSERLEEMIQSTKQSVNNVVRSARRGEYDVSKLDSLISHANEDLDELDKTACEIKDQVTEAVEAYNQAKLKLDELNDVLRTCKNKAETYGCENLRNVSTVIHEAELAMKVCRLNMLGTVSWLTDSPTIKALIEDVNVKVEICEEEIDRDITNIQAMKQEEESINTKYRQLQKRHEKVCSSLEMLKTSPPPRLLQAIAATDKVMSEMISSSASKHSQSSLSRLEMLVKEEEEFLDVDVHDSEIKLLELEKVATMVPVFLTKLAHLDAQVEAAGVQVASLVEVELGEAHRAVRSVEHALDTGSLPAISVREVSVKVTQAEQAVDTQVRRVTNAVKAQQEIKSQLNDLQLSYDELVEASAVFWAKSSSQSDVDPSGGGSSGDSVNQSRISLSMRIINQAMKRSEQLLSHARRRIEVPINVWIEFGPVVAQNALDNAKEGIRSAKQVLDSEQIKLDSNDLERRAAKSRLEDCSNTLITLRAMVDSFEDCSDLSSCYDVIDNAERAIEVAFRVLANGTVSSSAAAIEVSIRKTKDAENICNNVVNREERNHVEKSNIVEMLNKERLTLEALKDTINFLDIANTPMVIDALSTADRSIIGVDLVVKCEFGLPMLRKEFQLCKHAISELSSVIEREKVRLDIESKNELKRKLEERSMKQRMIEQERQRAMSETVERRNMQDKLEAAIHRLQLYWPAVVDVQNSMNAVEQSVETARSKLASGGLASANAAVASALSKVQTLEQVVMNIDAHSSRPNQHWSPSERSSEEGSGSRHSSRARSEHAPAFDDEDTSANMGLLETNLREVNERIEKQNKIMSIQYKLIMASNTDSSKEEVEKLRKELESLQR